ncbi:MAG: M24 family metallopeptidase [Geminicoccaceae bacterium]
MLRLRENDNDVAYRLGDNEVGCERHIMVSRYESTISNAAARRKALGSFGDLGPGELAVDEWQGLGLDLPNIDALRAYRLDRVREQLRSRDYAGILLTDPLNVRYATDSTNMQVWCTHNAVRYAFVATDGPVIVFDFHGSAHLSEHLPLVDEVRSGKGLGYFFTGDGIDAAAERWASEIADLVTAHGGGNIHLAIDKADRMGVEAIKARGLALFDGQEVMELARVIKSADEIKAMRCAIAASDVGMAVMQAHLEPGMTEQELWAHLHAENIKRGGEWIETRLLASGQRTNPWFKECSSRVIEDGDIVAFDTDLIGPYGYCADISRTWLCGDGLPTSRQKAMYQLAVEHIETNMFLLRPGLGFLEFASQSFPLPERYRANRYSAVLHGVGLCDEYPAVRYAEDAGNAYDGVFEVGMTVCVESYIGEENGPDGIKLEQQVLITEKGAELLSHYPLESRFSD